MQTPVAYQPTSFQEFHNCLVDYSEQRSIRDFCVLLCQLIKLKFKDLITKYTFNNLAVSFSQQQVLRTFLEK